MLVSLVLRFILKDPKTIPVEKWDPKTFRKAQERLKELNAIPWGCITLAEEAEEKTLQNMITQYKTTKLHEEAI